MADSEDPSGDVHTTSHVVDGAPRYLIIGQPVVGDNGVTSTHAPCTPRALEGKGRVLDLIHHLPHLEVIILSLSNTSSKVLQLLLLGVNLVLKGSDLRGAVKIEKKSMEFSIQSMGGMHKMGEKILCISGRIKSFPASFKKV